jgi:hypothetical protein
LPRGSSARRQAGETQAVAGLASGALVIRVIRDGCHRQAGEVMNLRNFASSPEYRLTWLCSMGRSRAVQVPGRHPMSSAE